jgi:plastocyanin
MRRAIGTIAAGLVLAVGAAAPAHARVAAAITASGVFHVIHGESRLSEVTTYALETPNRTYRLHFAQHPTLAPEATVRISGALSGRTITVDSASLVAPPPPRAAVVGSHRLLVIDVVWAGTSIATTQSTATSFIFGTSDPQRRSMVQYYQDASYGQFTWTGEVSTTLSIPDPLACVNPTDLYEIADAADSAASAAGYVLSNYDNRMYNFPSKYCGNAAWGEVGGARSWISNGLANLADGYERMKPTHEIGHNFGEYHGHGLECGTVVVSVTCLGSTANVNEYGDSYDLMGNNWTSDNYDAVNWMALPHQINLGWVAGRVINISDPGFASAASYSIAPIEQLSGNVGLVVDTLTRRYYVEARSAVGQDAFLTHWPDATSGVLVSMQNGIVGSDAGPLNLDTAPNSCNTDAYCDFHDAALNVGQTFSDVDGNFTLTLTSYGSVASVSVSWHNAFSPPTITSFSPVSGPVGTVVTINGTHFTGATGVSFGGTAAAGFAVNSDSRITATVDAGTSTGPIAVQTPGGNAVSTGSFVVTTAPEVDVSVVDYAFNPATASPAQAELVRWTNNGAHSHTITDSANLGLFGSGALAPGAQYTFAFNAAGSYAYTSTSEPSKMKATVKVPLLVNRKKGTTSTVFTFTWAALALPAGFGEDVDYRYKPPGGVYGPYTSWQVGTTGLGTTFMATSGAGAYNFRARLHNLGNGRRGGWSKGATVVVS